MKKFAKETGMSIWTGNLIMLASAVFLNRFGQGLMGGARTNFFIETLKLTGGQVLWLEGIRELPGLGLIFIAALTMRLPLSRRAGASLFIMGVGYAFFAVAGSYTALLAVAVVASLGMHMWFPLYGALAMCLSTKEQAGRVLGTLRSVEGLASLAGMGILVIISRFLESMSLSLKVYYVAGSAFIIVAAILVARIPTHIGATETKQPRMLLKKRYWLYYVLTFLQGSRKQVLGTFGTLVLVDTFGLRVWNISSLLLVSSVVNMLTAPYVGHLIDRLGERKTVSLSYVLLTACCIGFAIVRSVWPLVLLLIAIKFLVMFGMGLSTYIRRISTPEELTATLSAGISINHITSVAMPLIAGVLLPMIGYEGIFWGTSAIIVVSVPFALALRVDSGGR